MPTKCAAAKPAIALRLQSRRPLSRVAEFTSLGHFIMRVLGSVTSLTLLIGFASWAAEPRVPLPADLVRCERLQPVFESKHISKEQGQALLRLLDGGRALERWDKRYTGHMIADPPPFRLLLEFTLTNGVVYRIGFTRDGGVVDLPDPSLWEPTESARKKLEQVLEALESELRDEVVRAPKPCTYRLGTVEDGGTLSGVARLFYGDASKWRQIYQANQKTIKNPDTINDGISLVIPKLR